MELKLKVQRNQDQVSALSSSQPAGHRCQLLSGPRGQLGKLFVHSLAPSFNNYLFSTYCARGSVSGIGGRAVTKADVTVASM